ncbi:hypothetical protein ZIOFF_033202 [Zingiber officinale]|uniref:DUF7036 domain-containing protein n=1 Tax=Zingiber officinale TaxID=94328 RepID=A0A8J5GZ24_ZINOF|nr:hypothetical protein ZIOFF_033202 [Zingiber officinale]
MGKPEEVRVEVPDLGSDAAAAASGWRGTAWICRALSARCLLVLVLSAAVLLSAVFWLPLFRAHRSGFVSDDSGSVHGELRFLILFVDYGSAFEFWGSSAADKASFILQKPISALVTAAARLEYEIFEEIGIPNTKNAYVKLMNSDGSTVESPVTIEASVLSDIGSGNLLPDRMRQLAQFITGPDSNNLGLNNSVFGKVKQVQLSSYLENSISSLPPSPSPSPSDGIVSAEPPSLISISSPAPASAPALLNNHYGQPPCFYSHTLPSHSPGAYPPAPNVGIKSHQPQFHAVNVPVPSPSTEPPNFPPIYSEHSPNLAAPSSHEVMKPNPKVAREPSLAPVSHASSSIPGSGGGEGLLAAPLSSFISLSSGCFSLEMLRDQIYTDEIQDLEVTDG